jgi:hypothetical protein
MPEHDEQTPDYVTHAAWVRTAGRVDAIDEVADSFERPSAAEFWTPGSGARWPRSAGGWRSMARMHPRTVERRSAG